MNTELPKTKLEIELFCKNQLLEHKVKTQEIYTQFLENALTDLIKQIEEFCKEASRGGSEAHKVKTQEIYTQFLETALSDLIKQIEVLYREAGMINGSCRFKWEA